MKHRSKTDPATWRGLSPVEAPRPPEAEAQDWSRCLVHRKYLDLARPDFPRQYSARVAHAGVSFFFPLGTDHEHRAAAKARQIYQTVLAKGWPYACRIYPREFTFAIFWIDNPATCTYTSLLTAPGAAPLGPESPRERKKGATTVAIVEADREIRRALVRWLNQYNSF